MVSRRIKYTFLNVQLYLKNRTFYCAHSSSLLFLLCLIIGKLNETSKILMVQAHINKVKSPAFHFHTEKSKSILPKQIPREAVRLVYSQGNCILWRHSCFIRQEVLLLDFSTDFRDCLTWIFIWAKNLLSHKKKKKKKKRKIIFIRINLWLCLYKL